MKEVSSEKIGTLRDIILDRADSRKKDLVAGARQESEEWLLRETEKLQRETNLILQDARKRAGISDAGKSYKKKKKNPQKH